MAAFRGKLSLEDCVATAAIYVASVTCALYGCGAHGIRLPDGRDKNLCAQSYNLLVPRDLECGVDFTPGQLPISLASCHF